MKKLLTNSSESGNITGEKDKHMEIQGIVDCVHDATETRGFIKRELWLTTDPGGKYPQKLVVEFLGDQATRRLDNIAEGDEVVVDCDIRGHEWNGRRFVNIVGWRIISNSATRTDAVAATSPPQPAHPPKAHEDQVPF